MKRIVFIAATLLILGTLLSGCQGDRQQFAEGVVFPVPEDFVTEIDGKMTGLYTLQNSNGLRMDVTNYGGKVVALLVPDRNGVFDDIVTGYHTIDEFLASEEIYFGALIGRYGNRIGNARFTIDGEEYELAANNGPNHLHGGPGGFHAVVWDAQLIDSQTLQLSYHSPHMEEGYPGNLYVEVLYELTDQDEFRISYTATSDRHTVVNLTNHTFFNLAGEGSTSINDHMLRINADYYTPVDEGLIPTGEIAPVEGTPFDFRDYHRIGDRVDADHQQIAYGTGYDHNFVLNREAGSRYMMLAASIYDPVSGRVMEVLTTEPGLQFYGGNFLTGNETGKRGEPYVFRSSLCLETQHFPDSPNQPHFPSTLLRAGETYESHTIYRFSVKQE